MTNFESWVADRNKFWANPTGWLAIVGFHWLTPEPTALPGIEGLWSANDHTVSIIDFEGQPEQVFEISRGSSVTLPWVKGQIEVASRNGSIVVRPRDKTAELLAGFKGIAHFDYSPALKVEAEFTPAPATADATNPDYEVAGHLSFTINGQHHTLLAYKNNNPDQLYVIFRDSTSATETAATGRNLTATRDGGQWFIDFNLAQNFPCAYSDFTTCPVPPAENVLPVSISAGEKRPPFRVGPDGLRAQ